MPVFTETQSYGWLFNVIVGSVSIIVGVWVWRYLDDKIKKLVAILFGLLVILIVFFMSEKLETRIDNEGIHYQMLPVQFTEKTLRWEQIDNVYVTDHIVYSRRVAAYDVYSIDDTYGLYIFLNDGRKFIIGTKKPGEIRNVLLAYGR